MEYIKEYIKENQERFINELIHLLKIPSISADPAYKQDVMSCADEVAASLKVQELIILKFAQQKDIQFYADMIIDKIYQLF